MKLRKSFIIRLFATLMGLYILLLCVTGIGIYIYAKRTVGEEFRRLNQMSLMQLADAAGKTITDVISYAEKVSVSSRILQCMERTDPEAEKEIHSLLASLQSEFSESHTGGRFRIETAVIGTNDFFSSASNTERCGWSDIQDDERMVPLLEGETGTLLFTTENTGLSGIMKYSFQIYSDMRDLLSGDRLGVVVVDVSELLLFEQYRNFLKGDVRISIINTDGRIVSDANKTSIGRNYTARTEEQRSFGSSGGQIFLQEKIPGTEWILAESISEQTVFGTLTKLKYAVYYSVILTTVLLGAATVAASRSVLFRVMRLRDKMKQVIAGNLTVQINSNRDDEFGQIELSFNAMVKEIARLIESTRESEHQKRVAEMDFLNAQINSHFIHNTLTSIRFMLEMGQVDEAGEMIFYFSKLLRKTLSRSDEFIPLSEEIDTLKSYVMLQRYRYPNKFEAVYDIPEETLPALVPTLILQPVVENAIFHAAVHDVIHIRISAKKDGESLLITVEDDGVGMPQEVRTSILKKDAPMNRVGLRNVHDRIRLNYGQEYGLHIESEMGVGTKIIFLLPFDLPSGDENHEP